MALQAFEDFVAVEALGFFVKLGLLFGERAVAEVLRRSTKGLMSACSFLVRLSSWFFSIGLTNSFRKNACVPSKPGLINVICDHRSMVLFSTGVPVRMSRCRARSWRTACAVVELGFLIACDSSRMT